MRIENIKNFSYISNSNSSKENYANKYYYSPSMTGISKNKIKSGFTHKIKAFLKSKLSPQQQKYVKEVKESVSKTIPVAKPFEVKSQKEALNMFLADDNFSKKVAVTNPENGSHEIFYRMFDAASHEMRINADYFDYKGKLNHTTVYDNNGLKLSEYYVKINNPKDPILIRRKDYNVNGKITREEIKYKNGDITYVDYDDIFASQTFKTVKPDGSINVVKNTRYSTEIWNFDKYGTQINYKIIEY